MNPSSTPQSWPDDAQLMAYVDDALPPEERQALAALVAGDPALAARARRLGAARKLAHDALEASEALTVPPALLAKVQGMVAAAAARQQAGHEAPAAAAHNTAARPSPASPVAPPARPRTPIWSIAWQRLQERLVAWTLPVALACSALFGVVGFQLGRVPTDAGPPLALAVGQSASPALAALLDRLPSGAQGQVADTPVALVASFKDATGALCRDFSVEAAQAPRVEAVACRRPPAGGTSGWEVRYAAAEPVEGKGYAPATAASALDSYLASIGAHTPLDASTELEALAGR